MRFALIIVFMMFSFQGFSQTEALKIESLFQIILNVRDMEKQVKFYRDVLGLNVVYPPQSENLHKETFVRFDTGGAALVLHAGRNTEQAGQEPRISFRVTRLQDSRNYLLKAKIVAGEIRNPAPGVFVVDCKDPEGNTFHLESDRIQ